MSMPSAERVDSGYGRSWITMKGSRLFLLATETIALIKAARQKRLADVRARAILLHRESLAYRWDRWWGRLWGRWQEPTDEEIISEERDQGRYFSWLDMEEQFAETAWHKAEETADRLRLLAEEAGPDGEIRVTADDYASLWKVNR